MQRARVRSGVREGRMVTETRRGHDREGWKWWGVAVMVGRESKEGV